MIRPPDPAIRGVTLTHMMIENDEAVRRLLHLGFRYAHSCLDLTRGAGGCWSGPLPPGLRLTTNNVDPSSHVDLHVDYRATGVPDGYCGVVLFDPPHTADNGEG